MKPVMRSSLDTAGPTDFETPLLVLVAQGVENLLGGCLLLGVPAGLLLHPDQHVRGRTEALDLHAADAEPPELLAQLGDVGRTGLGLHLDQRPALEVDAVVQVAHKDR